MGNIRLLVPCVRADEALHLSALPRDGAARCVRQWQVLVFLKA